MAKSCWGCDQDYLKFYDEDELTEIEIYGVPEYVCPDCFDELPEDYEV